jgi:putative PIN family toxin of toxin-antitoxin system
MLASASASASARASDGSPARVVLDTNIVLDLCVFSDPATLPLGKALQSGTMQWIATRPMRDELERVLAYPKIIPRLEHYQRSAQEVLAQFDAMVALHPVAAKADFTCKDADDQKFIDLACTHQALLLSKDRAVLCMARRLLSLGVVVSATP